MRRIAVLSGFAVGYVLGTRAGRERYDAMHSAAQKAWVSTPATAIRALAQTAVERRLHEVLPGTEPTSLAVTEVKFRQ